jgi:NAD(P)H-dependent FMN reductase
MDALRLNLRMLSLRGTLPARSAKRAALVVTRVAEAEGAVVGDYDRLADVPAFNLERADERIGIIDAWRRRVAAADVLLVAAPIRS